VQGDRKWKSDLQETETQRKLIFVKKNCGSIVVSRVKMTEQRKCPAYLDQKPIVSVAKILQLTQKKQKASNCLEKE
jgi:hypothetical protein